MGLRSGKKCIRVGWLALYTAMYLCCAALLVGIIAFYGKSLIWELDGFKQHYTTLGYVGDTLRGLLAGKGYRMLSFSLGQGMDVLTTCSYYGFTDPLNWIAALFQHEDIEIAYTVTDLLRLYLAGVTFGVYMRSVKVTDAVRVACSAMVFVVSGSCIGLIGRHPYFINSCLYLPLLLAGVERILRERKWLMFTLVTALMLVVNFYFAFMNTVAIVMYVVVRLIARIGDRGVRESAVDGVILAGSYLLGMALSAVVFLPIVLLYLGNGRMGIKAGYSGPLLHYGSNYYIKTLRNLFVPWKAPDNYNQFNYIPLALFGLMGLFCTRGKRARQNRVALYLCGVAACVPMAGYLINGGAYVSNRWSYIVNFFVAIGCALGLQRLFKRNLRSNRVIAVLALAFGLGQIALLVYHRQKMVLLVVPIEIILFAVGLLLYYGGKARWLTRLRMRRLTVAATAVMCSLNIAIAFHPLGKNYIGQEMDRDAYAQVLSQTACNRIEADDAYRVTQSMYDDPHSLLLGYHGTSFYWSLVDGRISDYYRGLSLPSQTKTYQIYGLGASSVLNEVAGVRYYVNGDDGVVPAGYENIGQEALSAGVTADVYENPNPLPLGYAFDTLMPESHYDTLPVEEKMLALVRDAIVEDSRVDALSMSVDDDVESVATDLDHEIAGLSNIEMEAHTIQCGPDGGRVRLAFEAPEDSEVYVMLEGIRLVSKTNEESYAIHVVSDAGKSYTSIPNLTCNFYFPKDNIAVCIGTGPLHGCDIVFEDAAEYRYDRLRVVSIPLTAFREAYEARRQACLEDIRLSDDRLTGKISVAGDRVLQIAVPYSDGWRAWVDGEEQDVFRCGGMYMGIGIGAGTHEIEMRYVTPGLKAGAMISAAAALLTAVLGVVTAIKRRKERRAAR